MNVTSHESLKTIKMLSKIYFFLGRSQSVFRFPENKLIVFLIYF